jgi:hypothetical protein
MVSKVIHKFLLVAAFNNCRNKQTTTFKTINQELIMKKITGAGAIACMLFASGAQAAITNIDGQAGGGLVPWALLSSGPTVAVTHLGTPKLNINSLAVNTSFANMTEVSYARNMLSITGSTLPASADTVNVDNFGLKVKLNDMSDSMPQFALGLVYKNTSGNLYDNALKAAGINKSGTDVYAAASKIVNIGGKNVLLNGVLRASKANQMGLLGSTGGTTAGSKNSYSIKPELSVEVFAADNVIVGAEYRAQPSNGVVATDGTLHQNAAYDFHIVYVANKNFTLTAAYTNLGQVAPGYTGSNKQDGMLLQGQVNF